MIAFSICDDVTLICCVMTTLTLISTLIVKATLIVIYGADVEKANAIGASAQVKNFHSTSSAVWADQNLSGPEKIPIRKLTGGLRGSQEMSWSSTAATRGGSGPVKKTMSKPWTGNGACSIASSTPCWHHMKRTMTTTLLAVKRM